MEDEKLAATGLGLVVLGAGTGFALLPKLAGRAFGVKPGSPQEGGAQLVVRALGFRDIAFGLGLLASREQPEAARQWLRYFTVCMAGDVIACGLALFKPSRSLLVGLGALASAVFGAWSWTASRTASRSVSQGKGKK